MTPDDYFQYQVGQLFGCGQGAYGYVANQQYQQRQQAERERINSITSRPRQHSAPARPRRPSATAVFAAQWTENISDMIAGAFSWIPAWIGRTIRLIAALLLLGFSFYTGGGAVVAVLAFALGWFAPRLVLGLLRCGLYVVLAVMHVAWSLCVACVMLALLFGAVYAGIQLLTVLT